MDNKHDPPLILVADDQIPTAVMLERIFDYEGYQVHCVYDGISALEVAENLRPNLILLDINMPGLNGFEVLRRLRENPATESIPTILITAMGELSHVVQGLHLGADDYLRKPFHPQELLARAESKMKARLLEEKLQRRTQELGVLLRASEALSQQLAIDDLLNMILFLVVDLLPCGVAVLYHLDKNGQILECIARSETEVRSSEFNDQIVADTILNDNGFLMWSNSDDSRVLFGGKYACGMSVPLQHSGDIHGIVLVLNNETYNENHKRLLTGLGRQSALALHNAELYRLQAIYAEHLEDMVVERTQELESAQQMLVRSEKLASVGRLAASIAHEINNPLQPIQIMLEDMRDEGTVDTQGIIIALESVERIKSIVVRLLGFTGNKQMDNSEFISLDLNNVIEDIVGLNRKFFQQENISIECELSPIPMIEGNKYQLEHVFMNLVLNAKDAMQPGGKIMITSLHANGDVIVKVADTGCGIPPEMIDKIFEPFVSTKESGNGLGLFISYGIIEKHKGTIQVNSTLNQGTLFTLVFPTD